MSTINLQILTLVHVDGTIDSGVSGTLAVAHELVHSVIALAVVFARYVALRIRRAIIDIGLTIHAGVTERAGAFRRLFYIMIIVE